MASEIAFTLPIVGEMVFKDLALTAVIVGALIDSINPCAFGVLIFLMTYLTKVFEKKSKVLLGGILYTLAVFITYFLAGLGLMAALREVSSWYFLGGGILFALIAYTIHNSHDNTSKWLYGATVFLFLLALISAVPRTIASYSFYWLAVFVAFSAGAFEIKDFFWYGKGVSLDMSVIPGASERIKTWTSKLEETSKMDPTTALWMTIPIGFGAAAFELPCTGQVYLVILNTINASGAGFAQWGPWLLLYNFIFVAPLIVITFMMYLGMSSDKLEKWRKQNRSYMRLAAGLFLYALGAFLLWFTFRQFGDPGLLFANRILGFILLATQVLAIGYILYKGYLD